MNLGVLYLIEFDRIYTINYLEKITQTKPSLLIKDMELKNTDFLSIFQISHPGDRIFKNMITKMLVLKKT